MASQEKEIDSYESQEKQGFWRRRNVQMMTAFGGVGLLSTLAIGAGPTLNAMVQDGVNYQRMKDNENLPTATAEGGTAFLGEAEVDVEEYCDVTAKVHVEGVKAKVEYDLGGKKSRESEADGDTKLGLCTKPTIGKTVINAENKTYDIHLLDQKAMWVQAKLDYNGVEIDDEGNVTVKENTYQQETKGSASGLLDRSISETTKSLGIDSKMTDAIQAKEDALDSKLIVATQAQLIKTAVDKCGADFVSQNTEGFKDGLVKIHKPLFEATMAQFGIDAKDFTYRVFLPGESEESAETFQLQPENLMNTIKVPEDDSTTIEAGTADTCQTLPDEKES